MSVTAKEIVIQFAEPHHYEDIRALYRLVGGPHDYVLHFLPQWRQTNIFFTFVALSDGEVVGTRSLLVLEEYAWLLGMRVHPAWRNRTIARHLIERAAQYAASRFRLPVKGAVWAGNGAALRAFTHCGFTLQPGFALAAAQVGDVMAATFDERRAVAVASGADAGVISAFLQTHYQLNQDNQRLYGEDFIWHSITSNQALRALLSAGRMLVMREAGVITGVALVHRTTYRDPAYRVMEIGKIWGDPGPFLWFIAANYGPDYFRWYLASEAEEARSRTFGFAISRAGPHERRYIIVSRDLSSVG